MFLVPKNSLAQGINDAPYSTINTDQLDVIEAIGFEAKDGIAVVTIESDKFLSIKYGVPRTHS